jgi:MoxR-like ATPase
MFDFPVVGNVKAHPNFRLIAAGNTPGMGATDMFTERQALDAATLDRFVVFKFDYDPRIEELLAKGNKELLDFIRGLRKAAEKNQQRIVLGYRVIQQATAMLGIFSDVRIMSSSIFKDIDVEVVRMLIRDCGCHGRFVKAANEYVEYVEMA